MRRKTVKLIALALPAALVVGAIARPTSADESTYTFTMTRRAVNGEANKRFHALSAGELTVTGEIWVTERRQATNDSPESVKIEVYRKESPSSVSVCKMWVVPSRTHFRRQAYRSTCGQVVAGSYWIIISRNNDDGWFLQGSGALTTH